MPATTLPVPALRPTVFRPPAGLLRRWARWWLAFSTAWQGGLDAPRRSPSTSSTSSTPSTSSTASRLVARTWHGRVPRGKADAYEQFLARSGYPDYAATPGHRGMLALRQDAGEETHFLLLTLWESREAIARFAGDDITVAKYYPEDPDYLLELEPHVSHYDVVAVL